MGSDEAQTNDGRNHDTQSICLHAFADLSRISPPMFVALLKACYVLGTEEATKKLLLQQQVRLVLQNSPQPGLATFLLQCLYVTPVLEPLYADCFSQFILSSLSHLLDNVPAESEAKKLAAKLFLDVTCGFVTHEHRVVKTLLEVADVKLENIAEAVYGPEVYVANLDKAKDYMEKYIVKLVESRSFVLVVPLLDRFCREGLLMRMIEEKRFTDAEKWAASMGNSWVVIMISKYLDLKMLNEASDLIKENNIGKDFPEVRYMRRKSKMESLAEDALWDLAEERANGDKELLDRRVYLAWGADYPEKAKELCERHGLNEPQDKPTIPRFLPLKQLFQGEIVWIDSTKGLERAVSCIEECKVIGFDCEWKPNYQRGREPNKVSIMQIASEKAVFILDLIKLYEDAPESLDECLQRILHSSSILKLGYNPQSDLKELAQSYGELECFKHCNYLLDIENVFKDSRGGLSGLAEEILGASLNKTRRNSDWEERPLTQQQREYAALDAVVLLHIFNSICDPPQAASANSGRPKIGWQLYVVSYGGGAKKARKKKKKSNSKQTPQTQEHVGGSSSHD